MLACYVDESGNAALLPHATSPIQPILCLLGLAIDLSRIRDFTLDFIDIKSRFFPVLCGVPRRPRLSRILVEIKGADIRTAFREPITDYGRLHHHIGFLDAILELVERHNWKIFGNLWVKPIGTQINEWGTYTKSLQDICATFNHLLHIQNDNGLVIYDPIH